MFVLEVRTFLSASLSKSTILGILMWSVSLVAVSAAIHDSIQSASGVYLDLPAGDGAVSADSMGSVQVVQYLQSSTTVPTPLQQIKDMVPAGAVECNDGRVLRVLPSGNPVCVFVRPPDVLERRGFAPPPEVPCGVLSAKQLGTSEKTAGTGRPFVTTWGTISQYESITIPVGNATGTYAVDWGDGSTSANVTGDQSHMYCDAGIYTVSITGDFEQIHLNGDPVNAPKLRSIEQWGDASWTSMDSAFYGARTMAYNADDVPDMSGVTDMSCMFAAAIYFDGDISDWDASDVKSMPCTFVAKSFINDAFLDYHSHHISRPVFNPDVSDWDVSGVKDMSYMFYGANSFSSDLSDWDVSGVKDMSYMFGGAGSFNGDISGWNVSGVKNMSGMFKNVGSFNGDISTWDVSGVTRMSSMFQDADSFAQNMGRWYITLDSTSIDDGDSTGIVGNISAQNHSLKKQNPAYGIGIGGDSELFEVDGKSLKIKASANPLTKNSYAVNITSTGTFGTNNFRIFDIVADAPQEQMPTTRLGNKVMTSNDCDTECIAILNPRLDTSSPLIIEFDRFVDSSIDGDEGLYIQYSTDDTNWITLASYTEDNGQDTDEWEDTILTLDIAQSSASLRFVAKSNSPSEFVEIDNLSIYPKDS